MCGHSLYVLKRTIRVMAVTFLVAASGMAQQILVDGSSGDPALTVTLTSTTQFQNLSITSSSSSSVAFRATVTQTSVPSIQWVSATPTSGSTPATLSIQLTNDLGSLGTGPFYATVTLTGGGGSTSIAVVFAPGQTITSSTPVTPSSLTVGVPGGSSATNMLILENNTGETINITQVATANGSSWLSGSASPTAVTAGSSSIITVTTSAGTLPNGEYSDSIVIDISGLQAVVVPVTFTVGASGLTLSTVDLGLLYSSGTSQSENVSVAGVNNYNAAASTASGGSWLVLTAGSQTGTTVSDLPAATQLTVVVAESVAAALPTGNYTGSIFVSDSSNSASTATISVTLSVNVAAPATISLSQSSLSFFYQTGAPNPLPNPPYQTLYLSAPAGPYGVQVTSGANWLFPGNTGTDAGTIPGTLQVNVASLEGIAAGNYSGNIAITAQGLTQNVPVSLTVTGAGSPVAEAGYTTLVGTSGTVLFTSQGTVATPSSQPVTVSASDGSAVTLSNVTEPNWLSVTQSGDQLTITPNLAGLGSAVYSGVVIVNVSNSVNTIANSPISIPVVLVTNGGTAGPLSITTSQNLNFTSSSSGVTPAALLVTVNAATATPFTLTPAPPSWAKVAYTGNLVTPQTLSVTVNPAGLSSGSYSGTINLTAGGVTQTVPISLTVTGAPATGTVSASQPSLAFTALAGGPAQSQTVSISSSGAPVSYTVSVSSSTPWLTATPASGETQSSVTITADPASLAAGSYQGTVTITSGNSITVAVTLTVQAPPTVSVSASTLSFVYLTGGTSPPSQTVTVSGNTGGFTATAASTGNWLSVSPTSGNVGSSISVSVNPSGLSAGTQTGTITIAGTGGLTGQVTIAVSLAINPPLPSVSAVVNAASFLPGPISPGEIITLFGTNIGPATPLSGQLDSSGKLATTLGGVQVVVNGFLAPMVYVSATQVSAVVPYEIAPYSSTGVGVQYQGQTSNITPLAVAATTPGLFTLNSSGSGPAAFNANFSLNGPNNPSPPGSTVVFYLTGTGQTVPPGVTGTINSTPDHNPVPAASISILIGGLPATYSYAGGVEGIVEGLIQLNVQIPGGASSGNDPVVVTIGANSTQSGVTVSVE
jgi:uncharacterized protein (TIGR03437 family)